MEIRAWALVAFPLVPALALSGACGEAFSNPGEGGNSGGSAATSTNTGGAGAGTGTGAGGGSGGATTTSSSSTVACKDEDNDGVTDCDGDCDDKDPTVYPGAPEICGDAKDNDCKNGPDDTCGGIGTYVSNAGSDSNPGTQAMPVATIKQGIQNAITIGNGVSVYVAEGHYPEDVVVVEGVSLYGGHDPVTWARDVKMYDTAILSQGAVGVYVGDTVTRKTEIDGFRLQGKDGQSTGGTTTYGAAITLDGGTPTIHDNEINGPAEGPGTRSIGIAVYGPSNNPKGALIKDNDITAGSGTLAAPCEASIGVLLEAKSWPPAAPGAAAEIRANSIRAGLCKASRGITSWSHADGTTIAGNVISAGTATTPDAWGITVSTSPLHGLVIIDKNKINIDQNIGGCPTGASSLLNWCGGIDSQAAKALITNNIVFGVSALRSTAVWLRNPEVAPESLALNGNFLDGGNTPLPIGNQSAAVVLTVNAGNNTTVGRIGNNILLGGSATLRFGVFEDSLPLKTCKPELLENNDFFFRSQVPADTLYRSWDGAMATKITTIATLEMTVSNASGNMNQDPLIDASFHIGSGSPCIDKGTMQEAPSDDFEGDSRPKGGGYDIGADER